MANEEYIILLKKILNSSAPTEDALINENNISTDGSWIALGHVDEIYTYELTGEGTALEKYENALKLVHKYNSGSVYYHPILAFLDEGSISGSENFWFTAFVRIHFLNSTGINKTFGTVKTGIKKNPDFKYRIFRATEFSDMIVEIRGDNLGELINAAMGIRAVDGIGAMYTYFAVSKKYIDGEKKNDAPPTGKNVDFWALRFSGPFEDEVTFPKIKEKLAQYSSLTPYFVTGVDDILFRGTDIPQKDIIEIMRWQWPNDDGVVNATTRLGKKIGIDDTYFSKPSDTFKNKIEDLNTLRETESKAVSEEIYSAVNELVNTVKRMAASPVMDEAFYLTAPSLEAFLDNIKPKGSGTPDMQDTQDMPDMQDMRKFTEHCAFLMEQLTRSESQLSVQSELRPAVYDIPVFMLEYTVAFLHEVSELLLIADGKADGKQGFRFLPVPILGDEVKTVEIFGESKNGPGLIQLEFPVKELFHPERLLPTLCHETAHYVGSKSRMRTKRINFYVQAAADTFVATVFKTSNKSLCGFVASRLSHSILDMNNPCPEPKLAELGEFTENWIRKTFEHRQGDDQKYYKGLSKFFCSYLSNKQHVSSDDVGLFCLSRLDFAARVSQFLQILKKDVADLFSEVYADVCMLHILGYFSGGVEQPVKKYIESILSIFETETDYMEDRAAFYAFRIYAALTAFKIKAEDIIKFDADTECADAWNAVKRVLQYVDDGIRNKRETGEYLLRVSVADALSRYAAACLADGKKEGEKAPLVENIDSAVNPAKTMFEAIRSKDLNFTDIINYIDKWRQTITPSSPPENATT